MVKLINKLIILNLICCFTASVGMFGPQVSGHNVGSCSSVNKNQASFTPKLIEAEAQEQLYDRIACQLEVYLKMFSEDLRKEADHSLKQKLMAMPIKFDGKIVFIDSEEKFIWKLGIIDQALLISSAPLISSALPPNHPLNKLYDSSVKLAKLDSCVNLLSQSQENLVIPRNVSSALIALFEKNKEQIHALFPADVYTHLELTVPIQRDGVSNELLSYKEGSSIVKAWNDSISSFVMRDFVYFANCLYFTSEMREKLFNLFSKYDVSCDHNGSSMKSMLQSMRDHLGMLGKLFRATSANTLWCNHRGLALAIRECINDIKTLQSLLANPDRLDEISALMWTRSISLLPSDRSKYIAVLKEAMQLIRSIRIDEYNASKVVEYVRTVYSIFETDSGLRDELNHIQDKLLPELREYIAKSSKPKIISGDE